ncbi:MAG: T9SS type A sorting domain-containing protein [Rhodothermales bacterium]
MRRTFLPALLLASATLVPVQAQSLTSAQARYHIAPPPEAVCILKAVPEDLGVSFGPRTTPGKAGAASATFSVNYLDAAMDDPWPQEAKDAFDYALGIWATHIESAVPIAVDATWAGLGGCDLNQSVTLGSAGPTFFISDFGAGEADTYYPIAQVEAMIGSNFVPGSADIIARFNRACDDPGSPLWYFGTDANPGPNQVDFVSVVLHEIGHGLGFTGTADVDDGLGSGGSIECDGTAGHGCFSDPPSIYDRFTTNAATSGVSLLETGSFPMNSTTLGDALQGGSGAGVFFDGPAARYAHGAGGPRLFAPAEWDAGSSFAHLDESSFHNTANALMTPALNSNEAVHLPGPIVCGIFQDMGWPLGSDCLDLLPVELTRFEAIANGRSARLTWSTASETNNAGFEVEYRTTDGAFASLGFVPGAGTTSEPRSYAFTTPRLTPGSHRFRLRQVDFDGGFTYSRERDVTILATEAYEVSAAFPNPFNPQTQLTVAVQSAQRVRVSLYNVLGARVLDLEDAPLDANRSHTFTLDAAGLPSGLYLVRVIGETFTDTQTVTLLK